MNMLFFGAVFTNSTSASMVTYSPTASPFLEPNFGVLASPQIYATTIIGPSGSEAHSVPYRHNRNPGSDISSQSYFPFADERRWNIWEQWKIAARSSPDSEPPFVLSTSRSLFSIGSPRGHSPFAVLQPSSPSCAGNNHSNASGG